MIPRTIKLFHVILRFEIGMIVRHIKIGPYNRSCHVYEQKSCTRTDCQKNSANIEDKHVALSAY